MIGRTIRIRKSIKSTLQVDGVHCWADMPDTPELADVQFLRHPHRHMWYITAWKYVTDSDREIEFIQLKRDIQTYLNKEYFDFDKRSLDFGSQSCEMIAEEIAIQFDLYKCEVSEDNENSGIVEIIE